MCTRVVARGERFPKLHGEGESSLAWWCVLFAERRWEYMIKECILKTKMFQ
uniref:Uncharacterized protein n=1 Tax=Arabidopsis thaliana TaxID=3702 RepID=Q8GXN4_ARATH|nr:unknown protein [Arabidopsis thaliana]